MTELKVGDRVKCIKAYQNAFPTDEGIIINMAPSIRTPMGYLVLFPKWFKGHEASSHYDCKPEHERCHWWFENATYLEKIDDNEIYYNRLE